MSAQAPPPEQPFPPGLSLLERLPDELKLKITHHLPSQFYVGDRMETRYDLGRPFLSAVDVDPVLQHHLEAAREKAISLGLHDEMLSLASTSVRLCNVFFGEYVKTYSLQTALYRSIEKGYVNLIHRAVQYGADINRAGDKYPYDVTALRIASRSENIPAILYLLRCGVEKADELIMDLLSDKQHYLLDLGFFSDGNEMGNYCRCEFFHVLMAALFGGNISQEAKPRLPLGVQGALVPSSRHLWFILRTYMLIHWGCDCWDADCPMHLVSLLRRHGARWMPCEAYEPARQPADDEHDAPQITWHRLHMMFAPLARGVADLGRFQPSRPPSAEFFFVNDPILSKPTIAGAMSRTLLGSPAYRRDHCVSLVTAILDAGVPAEEGDLTHAMRLAEDPTTKTLSVEIVRAILTTSAAGPQPGAMDTAMRLACMETSAEAAFEFVSLLLTHGEADPREPELQDEIQGAAEKWWVQAGWRNEDAFRRILALLDGHGLDAGVSGEICAVLGLIRGPGGEEECVEMVEM
ncbi:hypothetical protein Daus18300_012440 [Diaporthe australafricana]|uniref:Ankyrin repeat protein n=1 Tax=Diaporthe australafricana TaxID=127596 RepID=A0ABR3W2R4_9PEZI